MGCGVLVGFEDAVMFLPVRMIVVMFFEILVSCVVVFFCKCFGSSGWVSLLQRE